MVSPPSRQLLEKYHASADHLIAADGGGNVALNMGIVPDVAIGDLDSFEENPPHTFEIIRRVDQETNDLEKALVFAQKKSGDEVKYSVQPAIALIIRLKSCPFSNNLIAILSRSA